MSDSHKAALAEGRLDLRLEVVRAILDSHPKSGIEDLMPWRYAQPSSLAA